MQEKTNKYLMCLSLLQLNSLISGDKSKTSVCNFETGANIGAATSPTMGAGRVERKCPERHQLVYFNHLGFVSISKDHE